MTSLRHRVSAAAGRVLVGAALAVLPTLSARAALYDLSEVPLFLGGVIEPNIMLTVDDSGSMAWSFVPDSIENDYGHVRGLAARRNALAYDPSIDYLPPFNGGSEQRLNDTDADRVQFDRAWDDGYAHAMNDGSCPDDYVNLSSSYRPTWYFADGRGQYSCDTSNNTSDGLPEYWGSTPYNSSRPSGRWAFYYVHYWDHPNGVQTRPSGCNATDPTVADPVDDAGNDACYLEIKVAGTTGGLAARGRTTAEEQLNFANWYSYYRKRTLSAKAGIGNAFSQIGTRFRVGFGRINSDSNDVDDVSTNTVLRGVRPFKSTDRDDFFDLLFKTRANGSTPLRDAMKDVGQYFSRRDDRNPWVDDPSDTSPPSNANTTAVECRKSFHLLMSDGYWNGSFSSTNASAGNQDATSGTTYTGRNPDPDDPTSFLTITGGYTAGAPFQDSWSSTLADIAMYYWKTDLQPDVPNEVRRITATGDTTIKQPQNPAFWQHLVTYTIAFGLDDTAADHVDPCCAYRATANALPAECTTEVLAECPASVTWPQPAADSEYNLDDMLHAAVNTRGGFLNARDPVGLQQGIVGILEGIVPEDSTAASVVLNSGVARTDSLLYQALFTTDNWQGEVRAFRIQMSSDPTLDGEVGAEEWSTTDAGKIPDWDTGRKIVTYNGTAAVPFRWNQLTTAQKQAVETGRASADSSLVLNFLRGDQRCEARNASANGPTCRYGGSTSCHWERCGRRGRKQCYVCDTTFNDVSFRDRNYPHGDYVLGDITNSAPAYVGTPSEPYVVFDQTYRDFRSDKRADGASPGRPAMIYVGANDGMLHAINAGMNANGGGSEVFAYVPSMVIKNLSLLSAKNYSHNYYVDGSPTVQDWCRAYNTTSVPQACSSRTDWRTALVGGLGAGGQGIYALDVTDPSAADEAAVAAKLMWEFSDRNTVAGEPNGDSDLGYTFSRPNIVRLNDGNWYAVFGNGYNNMEADGSASTTGNAVLYIVRLGGSSTEKGRLFKKLDTGIGQSADPARQSLALSQRRPNGLSTVAPIDRDGDYKIDAIYGGDLFGNLWKFDLSCSNPNGITGVCPPWSVAYSGQPLFTARASSADATTAQPITTRPQVVRHPRGGEGVLVVFGTGKYFETGDNRSNGQLTQSVYGIWDRPSQPPTASKKIRRVDLKQQEIEEEVTASGASYRVTSDEPVNWYMGTGMPSDTTADDGFIGWYLDLVDPDDGDNRGERQVSDPIVRGGKVIFTTLMPYDDVCQFGGDGWLMELDAATGGRLAYSPFDVDGDGEFTLADVVDFLGTTDKDDDVPPSGRKSSVGIIPTPAVLARSGGEKESKYMAGSKGGQPEAVRENPGPGDYGRQSWQPLFR